MPGKFPIKRRKHGIGGYPEGIRDFISKRGARLRVEGRGRGKAIVTLPSGTTLVFVNRRAKGGQGDFRIFEQIEPDAPGKAGTFRPISARNLDLLRADFPVLGRFGWPV